MKSQEVSAGDVRVGRDFWEVPNLSESSNRESLTDGHHIVCGSKTGKSRAALILMWGLAPHRGSDVGVDEGCEYVGNDKRLNKEG